MPTKMRLYHASSSYFSMIARLALLEAGLPFETRRLDIHFAKEQLTPWYIAINPAMTVPSLADANAILTDSRDILRRARDSAGTNWMDSGPAARDLIEKIVADHYAIKIEYLTFGTAFLSKPLLRYAFLHFLKRIVARLERSLPSAKDPQAILRKVEINRERLSFFASVDLADRVGQERVKVAALLDRLPVPGNFLLGDRTSSADVVVGVLLARLKMIGLYSQFASPHTPLDAWYLRYRRRDIVQRADLWEKFQPLRVLMKR